jgi:hypothetical protein
MTDTLTSVVRMLDAEVVSLGSTPGSVIRGFFLLFLGICLGGGHRETVHQQNQRTTRRRPSANQFMVAKVCRR